MAAILLAAFLSCGRGVAPPAAAPPFGASALGALDAGLSPHPRLLLSPGALSSLRSRAASGDLDWLALRARCDGWTTGTIYPPSGNAWPSFPGVGQGYQGDGYLPALYGLGLCWRVGGDLRYAAAGARVLAAMALPPSQGGQAPSTDSGYGIRNYGVGLAVGYDWLYDALDPGARQRAWSAANSWVDWYDAAGFVRTEPVANYFAGYLDAKASLGLAAQPEDPIAAAYWQDVASSLWGQLSAPAYRRALAGGGWPEGWQYGPRAVRAIVEAQLSARLALGLPWLDDVPVARDEALYLAHFAWPSLRRVDDRGTVHSGTALAPSVSLLASLAYALEQGSSRADAAATARIARSLAADVLAAGAPDDRELWQRLLYGSLPPASTPSSPPSYAGQPLSYAAPGPGHAATASSWSRSAVWASFSSGPYLDAPDSGEQLFDQGSLAVVRGGEPLLVNATGWIPTASGNAGEDYVYQDSWGQRSRRLYNTLLVADPSNRFSPGQGLFPAAATRLERYEEGIGYARFRGARIDDVYAAAGSTRPVLQFVRDVVHLRPSTFVVLDRTTTSSASADDAFLAFHVPEAPSLSPGRADVGSRGSIRFLLPRSASVTSTATIGSVARIEVRPPARSAAVDWLTVVLAQIPATAPEVRLLSAADGSVASGSVVGVLVRSSPRNLVVLLPSDHAATATISFVRYVVSETSDADHVILDVAPSLTGYSVSASPGSGGIVVTVQPGGPFAPSAGGTLAFSVSLTGVVSGPSWQPAPPSPPPPPPSPPPPPDAGVDSGLCVR